MGEATGEQRMQPEPELKEPKVPRRGLSMPSLPGVKKPARPANTSTVSGSKPRRAGHGKYMTTLVMIVVAVLAGFGGGLFATKHFGATSPNATTTQTRQVVNNESQLISQIAKDVGPSVVSVNVTSQSSGQQSFFGFSQPSEQQSAGTGIILSDDGTIVTNRHVVPAGTTQVSVTLSDGTELDSVDVIGRTADSDSLDVAFLKIKDAKGHKLTAATFGDSSKMQVGDRVVAIGNALGQFQNTVTDGIISGFGRSV